MKRYHKSAIVCNVVSLKLRFETRNNKNSLSWIQRFHNFNKIFFNLIGDEAVNPERVKY